MKKWLIGILHLVLLFTVACKENQDEIPPIITFTDPGENSTYNVLDDVPIRATISDETKLESVVLTLISEETDNKVLGTLSFSLTEKSFTIDQAFNLGDSLLKSGNYYFRLTADDGENSFSSFRYIKINGIPKRKLTTLIVTNSQTGSLIQAVGPSLANSTQFLQTSYEVSSTIINNDQQQLYVFPKTVNSVEVFDAQNKSTIYSKNYLSGFNDIFCCAQREETNITFSVKEGEVDGLSETFSDVFTYQASGSRIIGNIEIGDKYVLAEEINRTGSNRTIEVLSKITGVSLFSIPCSKPIIGMHFFEDERALIFFDESTGSSISELTIQNSGLRTIRNFPEKLKQVIQITANEYVLATDGNVLQYFESNDNLVDYTTFANADIINYDDFTSELYISKSNSIRKYNYRTKSILDQTTFTDSIVWIDFLYNKN